ncbi:urea amidolyase associated protein UAAP1 [Roseospira goensis]|uniref:DUF1989 domain-containing protein n=1 Tax=Roseospira goensis TaxID=391922 RepID=A0A7W6RZF4_9PROT|nr:urea amidolyase associated protein UAAP1 [Roseospira goensis]MBB4285881.1 hypothetical protein [Roseospira goensis]
MTSSLATPLYEDSLPGGAHWSFTVRRGITLRLIDVEGGANVGMVFFNPANTLERYNAPDTLKGQHTFKLTRGHCLYSDMGRIFCSIVEDTVGWHDTVGGTLTAAMVAEKWGTRTYQEARNDWTQNGRDSFLVEGAKYGLTRRDLPAPLNLFSRVQTDEAGAMTFDPGNSPAGSSVALRFEMDTLVLFHTCPHPMNTADAYPRRPITYQFHRAEPVAQDDYCRTFRPENQRGFANTELYTVCAPTAGH